jgi:DNA-binding Lrp family transcriptional regulator
VTGEPLILTSLDFGILQEMYRSGPITIAGVDPRLSTSQMARRLKTSRSRVAARLRAWEKGGLLRGYDVWPNPTLLGLSGGSVDVRLSERGGKPAFFRRAALVDGAIAALEFLGDWVSLQLVAPDQSTLDRRVRLLAGLEGVAEVGPLYPWAVLDTPRTLSPLDLRILRALRERPRASLAETARAVRVTARTMTDRYAALTESSAVWFVPKYDFTSLASPVLSLNVILRRPEERTPVLRAMRARLPRFLEFGWSGFGPVRMPEVLTVFVLAPSAAMTEEIEATVMGLEGVAGVEGNVLVRMHSFPETFDSLLVRLTPSRDRPGRS